LAWRLVPGARSARHRDDGRRNEIPFGTVHTIPARRAALQKGERSCFAADARFAAEAKKLTREVSLSCHDSSPHFRGETCQVARYSCTPRITFTVDGFSAE
jgi:hypothetical protein